MDGQAQTALILDIIQGKTTVAEASRAYVLPPSAIEKWAEERKKGMQNALRTKPLEQALIAGYGHVGCVQVPFHLRSDNGLVLTGRSYTALVRSYGPRQDCITPYSTEQNGMVKRVIRTLKDQCVHRHRFENLQQASGVIEDWIGFNNNLRPHQALNVRAPAEAYALAA